MTDLNKSDNPAASGNKRGRPRRSQDVAITEKIVRTALRRFLKDGYGTTSIKRIIDDAGISSGTLYARFPNKAALFTAAVNHQVAKWEKAGPSKLVESSRGSLYDVVYNAVLGQLEIRDRQDVRDFSNLLIQEAGRFPELAKIYSDGAIKIALNLLTDAILQTPEGQEKSRKQAADLALTIIETGNGWAQMRIFSGKGGATENQRIKAAKRIARVIANLD